MSNFWGGKVVKILMPPGTEKPSSPHKSKPAYQWYKCYTKALLHSIENSSTISFPTASYYSSDRSLCNKKGEKSAISSGFFLRQVKNSSLLIFPSLSASNKSKSWWTWKQSISYSFCHKWSLLGSFYRNIESYCATSNSHG